MGAEMNNHEWRSYLTDNEVQQLIWHERRLQEARMNVSAAMNEISLIRNRCVKRKSARVLTAGGMGSLGDHDRQDRP